MLRPTLEAQRASAFNEVIYSRSDWERLGPAVGIEAFLYCGDDGSKARRMWRSFLEAFPSLSAAQVPLLRVHAIPGTWSQFAADFFEDVSWVETP
jgi:hypothetical protein